MALDAYLRGLDPAGEEKIVELAQWHRDWKLKDAVTRQYDWIGEADWHEFEASDLREIALGYDDECFVLRGAAEWLEADPRRAVVYRHVW